MKLGNVSRLFALSLFLFYWLCYLFVRTYSYVYLYVELYEHKIFLYCHTSDITLNYDPCDLFK